MTDLKLPREKAKSSRRKHQRNEWLAQDRLERTKVIVEGVLVALILAVGLALVFEGLVS